MNAVALGSPLLKLLRATRGDVSATKGPSHQALRLAIARAGRQILDSDILALDITFEQVSGAESLVDPLAEFALVGKLSSSTDDAGIVAADRQAIAAITSLRTTRQLPSVVPERGASIVESALAQPLLTAIITAWSAALEADKDADMRLIQGYRASGRAQSVRSLAMAIPQGVLNLYRIDLEFAGSAQGKLVFAFPVVRMTGSTRPQVKDDKLDPKIWTKHFADELREAPTRVDAILLRRSISVNELRTLRPGHLLTIPSTALGSVVLRGTQGALIGTGRLGQLSGFRAIRLNEGGRSEPELDENFETPNPPASPLEMSQISDTALSMGSMDPPGGDDLDPLEGPVAMDSPLAMDEPVAVDNPIENKASHAAGPADGTGPPDDSLPLSLDL